MKKDVSVELVRIIACLIVIGCHVYPEILVDGNCIVGRLFIIIYCMVGWRIAHIQ